MSLVHSLNDSAQMLALRGSVIVVGFALLGGLLALYAIYWIIFKMGKE